MPHLKNITLAESLIKLSHSQDDQTMEEIYTHLPLPKKPQLEQVLGTLLDPMSFSDLENLATGLKKAYLRVQCDNNTRGGLELLAGSIGLLCFTLELLNIARQQNQNSFAADLAWPQTLLKETTVQDWFKQIYAPQRSTKPQNTPLNAQEEDNRKLAERHWQDLDFNSVELYRVGTTSFTLRCRLPMLAGDKLILKCLLFPYTRIPEIVKATRCYALNYPAGNVPATTRVRSSTDAWILMDEVEGVTLREFLQERRDTEDQDALLLCTDLLSLIGKPLLTALNELSEAGFRHEDLAPSNIMIVRKHESIEKIVLIDLGRNYLYTRDIGLEARYEAVFIAPEVKNGQKTEFTSDLYSFGMILLELADPHGVLGEIIPDNFYRYAPDLARFVEDLIDVKPENRLLLFPPREGNNPFPELCSIFTDILKVLPSEKEMKPGRFSWLKEFYALFYPENQLAHAHELWRVTRSSSTHPAIARHAGRLYKWLVISLINTSFIFALSLISIGIGLFATPIGIIQLIPGCKDICIPFLNPLLAPLSVQNIPIRLISFSVGLIQAFYPNILAGLTARSISGRLAWITEFFLRFVTLVAFPLTLLANILGSDWWLFLLGTGLIIPTLTQILCHQLATHMLKEARGVFSTVPPLILADPSLKNFGQWGISLFCYIGALLVIWIGLRVHVFHDIWAYTFVAFVVNVVALCILKCIYSAPNVRGVLCRAFIAGKRLEAVKR